DDLRGARVDAERLRAEAEDRLHELERRLAALEAERDELGRRKDQVEAEAQRGLEERVARARPWLERARATLAQLSRPQREAMEEALTGLADALGDAALSERRQLFLDGLKKGDFVWLPRYKKRCQVARIYKKRRSLTVRLGRNELEVAFDDVTFYESL
ncbi:MAG: hypothetical protein O7G30_01865, partial [Proteobacteria bacterium]|nr:hypothetical protein [Pseudomonadota bacterium]